MNSLVVTDTDRATMEPAAQCAATMIGGYPDLKVQDPAVFVRHLAALLSEYPQWLLERAWIEIPRTIPKYKLDIAGIKEWLESQMSEKRYAYGMARAEQKMAQRMEAERLHQIQVAKDEAAFKEWENDHPGGTMRQFLGFDAYTQPQEDF